MRDIWGVTVALLISLLFMASLMKLENGAHQDTIQLAVAQQAQTLEKAAAGYITQYQAQLLAATTATTPATITVPMLVATNFLPASTEATDIYGQSWEVEVLQPSSGELQAFLITTGRSLDNLAGVDIAQEIGSNGGFYPQPSSVYPAGTIMGTGGAWEQPAANWHVGQGELAVYVDTSGDTNADYLYRNAVPGDLEANTMNTPLIMSAIETSGAACASSGAIAQDGTGSLLSCQSGKWESVGGGQWKAPVATYSALPGSGNKTGDVRLTVDTDRAFAWNGGSWVALAVDQNGDLNVPNNLNVGGTGTFAQDIGTAGYSPTAGLPPGWGGGVQTWDISAHGTIGVGPNNSSPNAYMNNAGTIGNQGVCIDNNAGSCSGWGLATRYTDGWAMVTSVNGSLNAQPESDLGSIHANDYYDRATGEWFSQVVNQVNNEQGQINNLTNDYNSAQNQINSINNNLNQGNCDATSYTSITTLCNDYSSLNNSVGGLGNLMYTSGIVGPAYQSGACYYNYYYRRYMCNPGYYTAPQAPISAAPWAQLVVVTGAAGYSYSGGNGGSSPYYCNTGDGNNQAPMVLSGGGQTATAQWGFINYPTMVVHPLTLTFTVPAGQSTTISLSGGADGLGCGYFSYKIYKE